MVEEANAIPSQGSPESSVPASLSPSQVSPQQVQAPQSAPTPSVSPAGEGSGFTSIRDHVAGLGLRDIASQYEDDESFVAHLVQQYQAARQSAHLTPYAQRYLQHANDFEKFLTDRQQSQQAAPQKQKFWNPPEFNQGWSRFVTRDENGNLALVPGSGVAPDILPKVAAYDQYVRDFVHRFTHNPQDALTPLINEVVEPLLEKALGDRFGVFQERSVAKDFLSNNAQWLYQPSAQGGVMRDQDGRMVLSENGNIFANLVYEAEQMGLDTVAKQQRYASRVLSAAGRYGVPGGSQQQQAALSVNDQQKQAFLHRPNPAGAIGLSTQTPQPSQSDIQLSLAERLRRDLAAGGVNDASLAAQL